MWVLSRLERALETLFEGGFRLLFRARLQPVEISRALERAMLDRKIVATGSVRVPNRYEAWLSPPDFERLAPLKRTVEGEVAEHLEQVARSEGLRPLGRVTALLLADPLVKQSTVRAVAMFDEGLVAAEGPLEHTRRMDPLVRSAPCGPALLVDETGREIRLDERSVSIGRALDNDFVIRDLRVSRHHALLDSVGARWRIRDLHSTNGTFVAGRRVDEALVEPVCDLSLGGHRLTLREDYRS